VTAILGNLPQPASRRPLFDVTNLMAAAPQLPKSLTQVSDRGHSQARARKFHDGIAHRCVMQVPKFRLTTKDCGQPTDCGSKLFGVVLHPIAKHKRREDHLEKRQKWKI